MRILLLWCALLISIASQQVTAAEADGAGDTAEAVSEEEASRLLEAVERVGVERINTGQNAQREIDNISRESRELIDEYQAQLKLVQGLETYIELLDRQLLSQEDELRVLETSVSDVAVIERQVLPLMTRMIDSLESFIELDVPFLLDERRNRVDGLKSLLGRSDVTVAEKCRRVFEAYQIENEFGRTIESYTGKLELADGSFDAQFLRIGRLGLLYSTIGADRTGFWDIPSQSWQSLANAPWQRMIRDGLRVARQEIAPQLIYLPVDPQGVAR